MRPIGEDETALQAMWESLKRVMEQARATLTARKVGQAALFEVERKDIRVKPRKPFDNRLEDDTWERYTEVWRKLLSIWARAEVLEDKERPPYRLTKQQGDAFDLFQETVEEGAEGREEAVDRLCLECIISVLDHALKDCQYDSVLISCLAVMGIREDGGWVGAVDYTTNYSAVIKVARMLVLCQAYTEREAEVAEKSTMMDEDQARGEATGIFQLVRRKVRRFMTLVSEKDNAELTPMDWIYDTRSYGFKIRYTTAAEGSIDWKGDEITRGRVRFRIGALAEMLHTLAQEAKAELGQLAMVGAEHRRVLPTIEWSRLEDDHGEDRISYSFLRDDRNTWLAKGDGWVLERILEARQHREEWVSGDDSSPCPWKEKALKGYSRLLQRFREKLWMLMHMSGGQPGRTTEVMGIRMSNTANGGIRNIFAHSGMICFVTSYHKNFRSSGNPKVIHRYLPREIGELLVWYLWLILPFWQQVQGMLTDGMASPFLWAESVVGPAESEAREQPERQSQQTAGQESADGEDAASAEEPAKQYKGERLWTADRARRIIQTNSERLLGHRLNISTWRHLAIAIANRYLNAAFRQGGTAEEEFEDEEGIEDNPMDEQCGHGTQVAGMVYARELEQGLLGTALRREKFRGVSRRWHRFLGFGAEDSALPRPGTKRARDQFDSMREEARIRRFQRLRQVDLDGQLRQMMGEGTAFRGIQEAVIRTIIRGESPVVQVTGTGGGKSLSFMLPAYCSPEGVTIVVVPLVALRDDLVERCTRHGIGAHVWQSRQGNRAASIVFVTPESAVTKGFREFVNRLQARQELDRVVVDECHVLPDGSQAFRPQLRELGHVLRELGVQLVFLTATLPPQDEKEFFSVVGISAHRVRLFRARTTRKNTRYRIERVPIGPSRQEEEEDGRVSRLVTGWRNQHADGRAIVYAGTIDRVERLGKMLGCEVYHSKVDTVAGKTRRLKAWIKGGGLIVATNALGLGVDVPDVRLVVHAGMPRRLRDYVQESGRAGRDGQESEAVVVCAAYHGDGRREEGREEAVSEYIKGQCCRRVVLDRVMDGWMERLGCEEGEAACDICAHWEREAEVEEDIRLAEGGEGPEEADGAEEDKDNQDLVRADEEFERQRRQQRLERWMMEREAMEAAKEVEEFKEELASWADSCIVCRLAGAQEQEHELESCPGRGSEDWEVMDSGRQLVEAEMFGRRRFERFSGCFHCGLPQAICERWEGEDHDGGSFRQRRGGQCQKKGLLARIYAGIHIQHVEEAEAIDRREIKKGRHIKVPKRARE